jgi:hypothetical protein
MDQRVGQWPPPSLWSRGAASRKSVHYLRDLEFKTQSSASMEQLPAASSSRVDDEVGDDVAAVLAPQDACGEVRPTPTHNPNLSVCV